MRRSSLVVASMVVLCAEALGSLAPVPSTTEPWLLRKLTLNVAQDCFEVSLFSQCHGVTVFPHRTTPAETIAPFSAVATDMRWNRLVLASGYQTPHARKGDTLSAYTPESHGHSFFQPMGIVEDPTVFGGNQDAHHIYVADKGNGRVTRMVYSESNRTISHNDDLDFDFGFPVDVSCATDGQGGSYLLVADQSESQLSLFQIDALGDVSHVLDYGSCGGGEDQFDNPVAVSICRRSAGYYDVYVCDRDNFRVVYLSLTTDQTPSFTWIETYTDPWHRGAFVSVATNGERYVYVADRERNCILVLKPELEGLAYKHEQGLNQPRYVAIRGDELAVVEKWGPSSGMQYFRIVPGIESFELDDTVFDATKEESLQIDFKLTELNGYASIHVLESDTVVREIVCDSSVQVLDPRTFYWNGLTERGSPALPGVYRIRITASFSRGETLPELRAVRSANVRIKGTLVPSVISSSSSWQPVDDPYVATGHNVSIDGGTSDITLTIDPGVRVMFTDDSLPHGIAVHGGDRIVAEGDTADSVYFMPHRKMHEPFNPGQRGLWSGIMFDYQSAGGSFRHCVFENGGGGEEAAVIYVHAPTSPYIVDVDSSYFRGSAGKGISTDNDLSTERVDVDHTHFSYCADYPLFEVMAPNVADVCATCTFSDNDTNGIRVRAGPVAEDWIQSSCTWPCCGQGWFYDLNDELHIKSESYPVLTLDPGVTIRMPPGEFIQVGSITDVNKKGALVARGVAGQMINFKGQDPRPDTGDWKGTHLRRDPNNYSAFSYCQFQGGTGRRGLSIGDLDFYPMLHCDQSSPSVHRCRFSDGYRNSTLEFGTGIGVEKGSPLIAGCKFQGNECGIAGNVIRDTSPISDSSRPRDSIQRM